MKDIERSKTALRQDSDVDEKDEFITASPLDYHLFRQEITSKYPAYSPPPPLVPIEDDNNSILPPLPNHPSRQAGQESLRVVTGATFNGAGGSIFHQPVRIATPAPSPPPSPAGPGGKGGKKQNYQTNQNFPFLYPPLDNSSNTIGGKGNAELQDHLVGKRWEGSDVPASILEAGQLFASRMRMSRSIRQLWDVRERFIKYERGWKEAGSGNDCCSQEIAEYEDDNEEFKHGSERPANESNNEEPRQEQESEDEDVQKKLDTINRFYVCTQHLPAILYLTVCLARCLASSPICSNCPLESTVWACKCFGRPKWTGRFTTRFAPRNSFPRGWLKRG